MTEIELLFSLARVSPVNSIQGVTLWVHTIVASRGQKVRYLFYEMPPDRLQYFKMIGKRITIIITIIVFRTC